MISFIIIGKNSGKTIAMCIESVLRFIKINDIDSYEIVYVDSSSTDKTMGIAQKYPVRILLITGEANAAIGRNTGVKYSKGEILFFIDSDMELVPNFYEYVFDKTTKNLQYPFVTGHLINKYYDGSFNYLYSVGEKIPQEPSYRSVTGGLMIVERELWERINGMDERLIRNQDLDFGLRLSKIGFPVLLDNHLFAVHHTINYFDKSRAYTFYFSKALLSPGLLMRKHLSNTAYLKRHYLDIIYIIIITIAFILLFFTKIIGISLFVFYLFIQIVRSTKNLKRWKYYLPSLMFKVLYSYYSMMGFLFYYPKKSVYKVIELKNNSY